MQTIPYTTPDGIIDLVRKDDHDAVVAELIDRLREARESHLHASARDVQTIQRQAVELSKWQALAETMAGECSTIAFGDIFDDTMRKYAKQALAAYESAKSGSLPDPLAEAVKRMEAVSLNSLLEIYREEIDDALHSFEDLDEALSSDKVVEIAIQAVRARLIQAAKGEHP